MKILMIHEITKKQIDIFRLEETRKKYDNWIFTFDDGLYSQFYYYEELLKLYPNNKFIFFISTNIINKSRYLKLFIESNKAHDEYFNNNITRSFMSLQNIKDINKNPRCSIGGHGHSHLHGNLKKLKKHLKININIKEHYNILKDDFLKMVQWFNNENIKLNYYCFPYNEENELLEYYIIDEFPNIELFGAGREDFNENLKTINNSST